MRAICYLLFYKPTVGLFIDKSILRGKWLVNRINVTRKNQNFTGMQGMEGMKKKRISA
jgi:hypothetical protein